MKLSHLLSLSLLALVLSVAGVHAQTLMLPFGTYLPIVIDGREAAQTPTPTQTPTDLMEMRREVIRLVNEYRVANSCPAASENSVLMDAAQAWSDYMRANDIRDHSSSVDSEWYKHYGYSYGARENIGIGYETAQAVIDGWKNSPNHNRTLLSCNYASQGATYDIGIGLNGRLWTLALGERLP